MLSTWEITAAMFAASRSANPYLPLREQRRLPRQRVKRVETTIELPVALVAVPRRPR